MMKPQRPKKPSAFWFAWLVALALTVLLALPGSTVQASSTADEVAEAVATAVQATRRVLNTDFQRGADDVLSDLLKQDAQLDAILRTLARRDSALDGFRPRGSGDSLARRLNELIDDPGFGPDRVKQLLADSAALIKWIEDHGSPDQLHRLGLTFSWFLIQTNDNRLSKAMAAEITSIYRRSDAGDLRIVQPLAPRGRSVPPRPTDDGVLDVDSYREAFLETSDGLGAFLEVKHWPNFGHNEQAVRRMTTQIESHFERIFVPGARLDAQDIRSMPGLVYELLLPNDDIFLRYKDSVIPEAIIASLNLRKNDDALDTAYAAAIQEYIANRVVVVPFTWD